MSMPPTCPSGWLVSTSQPTHLSLLYRPDGRSLLVRPTEPTPASADPEAVESWTVKGLAGYGPRYPIFAEAVTRDEAVATAESVMATIADGDEPTPVRVSGQGTGTEAAATDTNATDDATDDQAALTAFADESDDAG
ncbi:hypothetical protein [Halonotius sp. GCM10025705]|uniref:hypothetical protein n=1 Tax=Halonotius sp. GCM10025705 TaxID=3252678 RepID=UPI0036155DED